MKITGNKITIPTISTYSGGLAWGATEFDTPSNDWWNDEYYASIGYGPEHVVLGGVSATYGVIVTERLSVEGSARIVELADAARTISEWVCEDAGAFLSLISQLAPVVSASLAYSLLADEDDHAINHKQPYEGCVFCRRERKR